MDAVREMGKVENNRRHLELRTEQIKLKNTEQNMARVKKDIMDVRKENQKLKATLKKKMK